MAGNGKLFVSHTHADNERCASLLAALDAWGLDYWFDGQQLDAGQQLSPRLQEAILQRDVLLRVCTTNTSKSYWMNLEQSAFRAAEHRQSGKGGRRDARLSIDLVLDAGYAPGVLERADVSVSAINKPERIWLAELAKALGLQQRKTFSRRRALGLGGAVVVTAAGLAGSGYLVKTRDDAANAPYPRPHTIAFSNPQTMNSRVKWFIRTGDTTAATLALSQDTLIASASDGIFALNRLDGSIRWWRTDLTGGDSVGLAVAGDVVYASAHGVAGSLYALRMADGSTIWTTRTTSSIGDLQLTLFNGVIYMIDDNNAVVAYDASSGKLRWTSALKLVLSGLADRTPIATAQALYVGADDGRLLALSPSDGSLLWSFQTGGAIGSAVTLVNGMLYLGSLDQSVYAVDAASGALKWRHFMSLEITDAPAVANGEVYLFPFDTIFALDAASGALKWQAKLDSSNPLAQSSGPLEVSGDVIYAPAGATLYAFSASTKSPLWSLMSNPDDSNRATPTRDGAVAYWPAADGFVYALDTTVGG